MKRFSLALLALAVALAITPAALADTYTLNINSSSFSADLTLIATPFANGQDIINSVSGFFSNPDTSGIITLTGSDFVVNAGAPGNVANNGVFQWDNVLYTSGLPGPGALNWNGLLIDIPLAGGGDYQLNIFSNGTLWYWADNGAYHNNIPVTPEPGSLFLLGTGLLGLAVILFRKAKPSGLTLNV